jgi:hypothetical protein
VLSQLIVEGAMLAVPTLAPSTMKSTRITMTPTPRCRRGGQLYGAVNRRAGRGKPDGRCRTPAHAA